MKKCVLFLLPFVIGVSACSSSDEGANFGPGRRSSLYYPGPITVRSSSSSPTSSKEIETLPKRGIRLFYEVNESYAEQTTGYTNVVSFNQVAYVWLQGSGTTEIPENLVDTIWYYVEYTLTMGVFSENHSTYAMYDKAADKTYEAAGEKGQQTFIAATSLVIDGSLKGSVGTFENMVF